MSLTNLRLGLIARPPTNPASNLYYELAAMACTHCSSLLMGLDPAIPSPAPGDAPGMGRCPHCGAVVTLTDPWQALLRTLTQLARFGLDSEGRPLLEPAPKDV